MTQIFEELYLGNENDALSEFMKEKPTSVVNLAREANVSTSHVDYMEIPLLVTKKERIEIHFKKVNDFIDANLEKGYRVLVYSKYGVARSASFVVAYLMYRWRKPFREIYEYVKTLRNVIDIPFCFIYQLYEYQEVLLPPTMINGGVDSSSE